MEPQSLALKSGSSKEWMSWLRIPWPDFFIQCEISLWNALMQGMVIASTPVAFKKELDKYLEEKSIMGYMMDVCNLRMPDTGKSTRMQVSLKVDKGSCTR